MRRAEKVDAQHSVEDGGKGGDGREVRYVDVFFKERGNGLDMTVPSDITLFIYFIYTMWIVRNTNRRSRPVVCNTSPLRTMPMVAIFVSHYRPSPPSL